MARPSRLQRVLAAQELQAERLVELPNVMGVATGLRVRGGQTTEELCVQVFVDRKLPEQRLPSWARVPGAVAGAEDEAVPTDVIEITPPEAYQNTARYRPVPGGSSIGPEATISAGTLGGWAGDNSDNTVVLLSCNHVISNLDNPPTAGRIVQPARLDGGVLPGDVIGAFKRHVAVQTVANPPGTPLPAVSAVDAAIGTITVERTDNVLGIGPAVYELQAPAIGMNVQKSGRTTRLTTNGRIVSINATFTINYRNGTRIGRVGNSFVVNSTDGNPFGNPGDSGSLIFNQQQGDLNGTRPAVGVLYAGGTYSNGSPYTLGCDINAVFGALNLVTLCTLAVRALIQSLGGREASADEVARPAVDRKEAQLRSLRERVLRPTAFGKAFDDFVSTEAAVLSQILLEDEDAFGVAVRTLEPWLRKRTNYEILESEVDADTVAHVAQLTRLLARRERRLRPQLGAMQAALAAAQGSKVRKLLSTKL